MIFIFGGAHQGKLDFALDKFGNSDVFDCKDGNAPDFTFPVIDNIEGFVLECTRQNIEAADFFREHQNAWSDSILIVNDVSQGIVPIDKTLRSFREMNGRTMIYLASHASEVYRVFCGIGRKEK